MSLISDSELGALQDLVLSGLRTTIYIYNATNVVTEDGQESTYPSTPSSTVFGWLYEITPNSTALSVLDGSQTLSELFRLLIPIGTVIGPNDKVVVGTGSYYVQHTNSDNTYPTSLSVALRNLV